MSDFELALLFSRIGKTVREQHGLDAEGRHLSGTSNYFRANMQDVTT